MRNKLAKLLRRKAEEMTIGQSLQQTRKTYKGLKKVMMLTRRNKSPDKGA